MRDVLAGVDDLSDFLDTIFDVGADRSYIADGGLFSTQLSAHNGKYADDVYRDCLALSGSWKTINSYLDGRGFAYPANTPVSSQVTDVSNFISSYLIEEKLSSVSAVHDEY